MTRSILGRVRADASIVGVLAVAVIGLAACGDDEPGGTPTTGAVTAPAAVNPALMPAQGAAPWPASEGALRLTVTAGLQPERKETLTHHVHGHLDVFVNGKRVVVPAGIGINIKDPGVKTFRDTPDGSKAYGGIELCTKPCISPLHTHDNTGILHTESASPVPNRLGQFFTQWGVRLSSTCVGGYCRPSNIEFFVNGNRYRGDPRAILLTSQKEIAIVIGPPPREIPKTADFTNA
jgi:hypothetical protein